MISGSFCQHLAFACWTHFLAACDKILQMSQSAKNASLTLGPCKRTHSHLPHKSTQTNRRLPLCCSWCFRFLSLLPKNTCAKTNAVSGYLSRAPGNPKHGKHNQCWFPSCQECSWHHTSVLHLPSKNFTLQPFYSQKHAQTSTEHPQHLDARHTTCLSIIS